MSDEDLAISFAQVVEASQARTEMAEAIHASLTKLGRLGDHRVLTYRCPRRCLLLDVFQTPKGVLVHSPTYKLSPSLNAASTNDAGRKNNTVDGDRRWRAQTYFADQAMNFTLNCDHIRQMVVERDRFEGDLAAGGDVIIRPTD